MILGQSAGTAAAMAIDAGISVQKVPYRYASQERLLRRRAAALQWTGSPGKSAGGPIDPKSVTGIVVDTTDAKIVGEWHQQHQYWPPFIGAGYLHDNNKGQGTKSITYMPEAPQLRHV